VKEYLTTEALLANISGAIQPSVPVIPERFEKDIFPPCNFLHSPKSLIRARILLKLPLPRVGIDNNTLCGLMSL